MDFVSLDRKYVMSVARGPLSAAMETYKAEVGWDKLILPSPRNSYSSQLHPSKTATAKYQGVHSETTERKSVEENKNIDNDNRNNSNKNKTAFDGEDTKNGNTTERVDPFTQPLPSCEHKSIEELSPC